MKKKQIIFIMTDTQRTDMLGCYGNSAMVTPNLDRLAAEGIRYDKAYTTQPVCSLRDLRFLQAVTLIPVQDGQIVWGFPIMCRASDSD